MGYIPMGHKELDATEQEGGQKKNSLHNHLGKFLIQIYIFILLLVLFLWITLVNIPASVPNHIFPECFSFVVFQAFFYKNSKT